MIQFDEYRIFIVDGRDPFTSNHTTQFNQAAMCLLQKPVCHFYESVTSYMTLDSKPATVSIMPPPQSQCATSLDFVDHITGKIDTVINFGELVFGAEYEEAPYDTAKFEVPAEIEKLDDWQYTASLAGTYDVYFVLNKGKKKECNGKFKVTFE